LLKTKFDFCELSSHHKWLLKIHNYVSGEVSLVGKRKLEIRIENFLQVFKKSIDKKLIFMKNHMVKIHTR